VIWHGSGTNDNARTKVRAFLLVELRGLEPLTPTLPVWCATSCATAPCCPRSPGHSRNSTHPLTPAVAGGSVRERVGREIGHNPLGLSPGAGQAGTDHFPPGDSVQEWVGREVGHRGQDVALAAQDHGPQVVRAGHERVAGQGVEDEP
jgi:hypothetical protein